jgi:hypothetical protein
MESQLAGRFEIVNNEVFHFPWRARHAGTKGARFLPRALMITVRLGLLLILTLSGANAQTRTPSKVNYPPVIQDSTERRSKAEREWRRMLDAYSVAPTPPDLYPITYTPRSLLGVSGGIKLTAEPLLAAGDPLAVREVLRGFIERWREMIGCDPSALSLVHADQSSSVNRFTYKQANYPFPIAPPAGEMVAVVSSDGRLMQLDDRLIPVVELPARPAIESEVAAKRLLGRVFTYTDIAGREQRTAINGKGELNVKQLVVLPVEKADAIEIHLAWEVAVGSSLSWTVYLDAVTGEELRVVQNFQT